MSARVTVTGKVGPGYTVTAMVFDDCTSVNFNCITNILQLSQDSGKITDIAIDAAGTITATKSGSNYTFVIS